MKRNRIILILGMIIIVATVFYIIGNKDQKPLIQKFPDYGIGLEVSQEWDKQVKATEEGDSIRFTAAGHQGYEMHLFSIKRVVGDLITEEDVSYMTPVPSKWLMRANGYTYYASFPSDVQYDHQDEEETKLYKSLDAEIEAILDSVKSMETAPPLAKNEGFKVVGTAFFTLEIPENMDMVFSEELLYWNIEREGEFIGSVHMQIGKNEDAEPRSTYIKIPDTTIFTNIRMVDDLLTEDEFAQIAASFEYKQEERPVTVLDYLDIGEKYTAWGGKKLFGTIEDVQIASRGGEGPIEGAVITVNLMEFIEDKNQPNGLRITDLGERVTLESVDGHSPDVIPLVAPNFTSYGTYDRYQLDEKFMEDYGDESKVSYYKNFYYNFYLDQHGKLHLIAGVYVP